MTSMFEQALKLNDADFAVFMEKSKRIEISEVEINSLAVLKILKHCSENELQHVSGQLLGLGLSDVLQITNSCPTIITTEDEEKQYDEEAKYQYQMMESLQAMNIENNVVGWYQSCFLENYLDTAFIETQYNFQIDYGKKCVCMLFDTVQSLSSGKLKMKAIRLTDAFVDVIREAHKTQNRQLTQEILTRLKFDPSNIIEELQITITSSNLFSKTLKEKSKTTYSDNSPVYIEKLLENVIEYAEMFIQEENKFQYFQRKTTKKKEEEGTTSAVVSTGTTTVTPTVPTTTTNVAPTVGLTSTNVVAPNRLEALLIANQLKDSITEMEALISLSKKKLDISNKI